MIPTTPEALRIGAMFNRRPTSQWNEKEVRQFKKLKKDGCFADVTEVALLERYYQAERRKGDKGVHRRDLQTLLNNWPSELDRARAWAARFNRQPKEIKINPSTGEAMSDEEFQCVGKLVREQLAAFRMSLKP